ncbi:MAG: protein kinase [bacterium]|nr:protein kinase [bacterium]
MSVETPDTLSHYQLIEKIGEGGMGVVWRAIDSRLGREVAIKMLSGELAGDAERVARFEREARAIAALNHPNIITIYSVDEAEGRPFFTMELIDGQPLSRLIPGGGLPLDRLFQIAIPLADAVYAAHARGITHRDLKPGNIMVTGDGRVKVLDFGLARYLEEHGAPGEEPPTEALSSEGSVLGTLAYMSPEQIRGQGVDGRTDVYSLSVVLYHMATGVSPYQSRNSADLIAQVLRDDPSPASELVRTLPRQLSRIIRHGMQKDPRRRFQTVLDLRNELEDLRIELAGDGLARRLEPGGGTFRARPSSVAVLPLDNLSGDPDQDYFADGMTDALIADLARIGALKVISRTSVMQYKGARKPLREIAMALGVGAVVEGSVLRSGQRVRITAELIDAATDRLLWAETYERDLGDVLDLQSEVASAIARKILVKLTPREKTQLKSAGPVNPEAHEATLRGRYFWYKRTPESVKKGLQYFERAIEADPAHARAWTGIADSYIVDGGRFLSVPPDVAYGRAREAALEAVKLNDGLAEAHTSLAAVLTDYDWDWQGADREYRRAIELNPNYVTAHSWYAEHLSRMGRHEEAIREAEIARELDPLSLITNSIVAWILFFARRYDRAIEEARKTLELDPDFVAAHRVLGWAHEETGEYEAAIEAHRRASALSQGSPAFKGPLGRAYAMAGRQDEARQVLDELAILGKRTPISSFDVCLIHLALGGRDRAMEWLNRAFEEHSDHLAYLNVNPRLDALRDDPRFQELVRRMGFPEDPAPGSY